MVPQTTAVGGLLVGSIVYKVTGASNGAFSHAEIANLLTLLCGAIYLVFGLLRLGWIIEFVPYIPISAFVTAAGVTIMSTQVPTLLGITGINTRKAPYKVMLATFSKIPEIKLDAAIGVSSIILLFAIREFCSAMERRQPSRKRVWAFLSSLRMTFTMLLFILISYLVNLTAVPGEAKLRIIGDISRGWLRNFCKVAHSLIVTNRLPWRPSSLPRSHSFKLNSARDACSGNCSGD